jgi:prepilin-type N-terminal cleavage/methylation domain-containing protein
MTTFTTPRDAGRQVRGRRVTGAGRRAGIGSTGFTLVEVMIAATLGSIVLAGVLSTFLMISRSGMSAANYTTMDTQSRRALDEFSRDVRQASNVTWNSSASVTLSVPDNYATTSNLVTYTWNNSSSSSTYRCFYRVPGNSTATSPKTVFVRNVTSFSYARFDRLNATTTSDASTKRIQIAMTVTSTSVTVVATTAQLVSASFILRNKPAT